MDLTGLMKQVQRLQAKIEEIRNELSEKEIEGSAGGGMVKVVVNGNREVISVKIEPEALEDKQMLEDLIVAAINDALRKAKAVMEEEISKLTSVFGINLPGLF